MTLRGLHIAILRKAALLVPPADRTEWFAEWKAELHYVDRDATAFCLGSFRDAIWLRRNNPRPAARRFGVDSPLRCVLLLVGLATLFLLLAMPSRKLWLPSWSPQGREQFALGVFWMSLESLLVLLTLNSPGLGEYPLNRCAPSLIIRLRRWVFLAFKIALVALMFCLASVALEPVFPAAPSILFLCLILGLRWALGDQRRRCPVCLHLLSNPVEIGSPAQTVLGWYGTELICTRGHGSLYVPGMPTSWCGTQRWRYFDPSWRSLLS